MTNRTDPDELRYEHFEPLVDTQFDITIAEERFSLRLSEAKLLRNFSPDPDFRPPFALLFTCADQRILPQAIYDMDNADLGTRQIFLVPVGQDGEGVRYEAVFS